MGDQEKDEDSRDNSNDSSRAPKRNRWHVWRVVGFVAVALVAVLFVVAEYVVHHAEPMLRESIVSALADKFHSPVELDGLSVSVAHGLRVEGRGLRVMYIAGPQRPYAEQINAAAAHQPLPPQLSLQRFAFGLAWSDLRAMKARVDRVEVDGLQLHIPPHAQANLFQDEPVQKTSQQPRMHFLIGRVDCTHVQLYLETNKPGKDALRFDMYRLTLTDIAPDKPMLFEADLMNPHPVGEIHASGHLGPWMSLRPRSTPLDGHYVFAHADLGTIRGISGTLSSTGDYRGTLGSIAVEGVANVPDFALDVSAHPEPLHTQFVATVDGTTGDTYLQHVQALLGHSPFVTQGAIVRQHMADNTEGHDIALTVEMPHGHIEDLLTLGMRSDPAFMRGDVVLQAKLHIPPGHVRVIEKLQLAGNLRVDNVAFTNPSVQDRIDGLSMRAQGKPEDVKSAGHDRQQEVASQMAVTFALANGWLTAPSVHYAMPGATLQLAGVDRVTGNLFEFKGHIRTEARASQMVTGWKSMLLKPLDPIFAKNGAGLELPVMITGEHSSYKLGLASHNADETLDEMRRDIEARPAVSHAQ